MFEDKTIAELVKTKHEEAFTDANSWRFYDWFCKTNSLAGKSRRLFGRLKSIARANAGGRRFDPCRTYVFFKNNCPCYGDFRVYDDIRICDAESGKVLFNVCPRNPFGNVHVAFEGYGFENETLPLSFESWKDCLAWFGGAEFAVVKSETWGGEVWMARIAA